MPTTNRPSVRIHNSETNEVIDREMNDEEFIAYQTKVQAKAEAQAEAKAKVTARQEILDRLGLTADEAKLLLG